MNEEIEHQLNNMNTKDLEEVASYADEIIKSRRCGKQ